MLDLTFREEEATPTMNGLTTLIVFGGFAGTGKTSISRRLSRDLSIPRLSSDALRRTVGCSRGIGPSDVNAGWLAYDILFSLCEEFLDQGVSTIVDTNLGWEFHWTWLEAIRERYRAVTVLPIVLSCPLEICLQRIQARYECDPRDNFPAGLFTTDSAIVSIWNFLQRLDRPDLKSIDAARPLDDVYRDVREYVSRIASFTPQIDGGCHCE